MKKLTLILLVCATASFTSCNKKPEIAVTGINFYMPQGNKFESLTIDKHGNAHITYTPNGGLTQTKTFPGEIEINEKSVNSNDCTFDFQANLK